MLQKRIITSLIGIPLVIAAVLINRTIFMAFAWIVGLIALVEFCLLGKTIVLENSKPKTVIAAFTKPLTILFGLIYIGLPLFLLGETYSFKHGTTMIILIISATWIADTSAYFGGRYFGRRPLAKNISPNKTIEGAVISILTCAIVLSLVSFIPLLSPSKRAIFGFFIAISALLGDLFESWLKRRAGVKDSGVLLPGHGGMLDRIDSLLFASAAGYVMLRMWV